LGRDEDDERWYGGATAGDSVLRVTIDNGPVDLDRLEFTVVD
jgi:hypothetical protein